MKRVAIVGGGISGLTVAYALISENPPSPSFAKKGRGGVDVTVFEADSRPGGKIWSDKVEGFLCEKGPNGFLDNKLKTLELCKSLGLEPLKSNENAKNRFIFSKGKLYPLPLTPYHFLKSGLMTWHGKLRVLYEVIAPKGPQDETVSDFVIRRLGKEVLEKLIEPMCSGVFAGDPYKMSIKHSFPLIKELEQEYGSLIRAMIKLKEAQGKSPHLPQDESAEAEATRRSGGQGARDKRGPVPGGTLTSFYDGTQAITDILTEKLGERVKLGVHVKGVARLGGSAHGGKKGNLYQLHTSEGTTTADVVVLASPAYASAEILMDFDRELSKTLESIPYVPVSVVCFGMRRDKVGHDLNGFGFLIPYKEGKKILGTLWDSSMFPNRAPDDHVLLRSMVGGARVPHLSMLNDNLLINTVFDELRHIVSLKAEPDLIKIYRWEKAIPQYVVGHGERLRVIAERLKSYPHLYLTGNAYRGVSMNDCIENGYRVAEEIIKRAMDKD